MDSPGGDPFAIYMRWNDAIAEEFFSTERAFEPVYIDLEDDALARVAERVDGEIGSPVERLAAAVTTTLDLAPHNRRVFLSHEQRLRTWASRTWTHLTTPPPHIGLLGVLSLAAEVMGAGSKFAPHNYYGRLAEVLGLPPHDADRLAHAYRRVADWFWGSLEAWLEANEHLRGSPSAYSLGAHRYIGYPISQALIRADDRRRLEAMFGHAQLNPGQFVATDDMARLLDDWVGRAQSEASNPFRQLWADADTTLRDRVAEVAITELAAWSGASVAVAGLEQAIEARLVARVTRIPVPRLRLGLAIPSIEGASDELVVEGADVDRSIVPFEAVTASWRVLRSSGTIDVGSLLLGEVSLADEKTCARYAHRPRGLYTLVRDEASQLFLERERLGFASDSMLFARSHLVPALETFLRSAARSGWSSRHGTSSGDLPEGWTVFTDVQLLALPAGAEQLDGELARLVPAAVSELSISGGLRLPGLPARWSTLDPPEVRGVAEMADSVRVVLRPLRMDGAAAPSLEYRADAAGMIVVDLGGQDLGDGDYEVLLYKDRAAQPAQRKTLRLRSAATATRLSDAGAALGRDPATSPLDAISAGSSDEAAVRGAIAPTGSLVRGRWALERPRWLSRGADRQTRGKVGAPLVIASMANPGCLVTGAHRWRVPMVIGRPRPLDGRCDLCGLEKTFTPTWAKAARRRRRVVGAERLVEVPRVRLATSSHEPILDVLSHLQRGDGEVLDRLALGSDGTALTRFTVLETLESLGHVEIRWDLAAIRSAAWSIGPSVLAGTSAGDHVLLGRRSRPFTAVLANAVGSGRVEISDDGGFLRIAVPRLREDERSRLEAATWPDGWSPPAVIDDAASRLGAALPPLSRVGAALPRVGLGRLGELSRFDIDEARWVPAQQADRPGAYRSRYFTSSYLFRTADDISQGRYAPCDARLVRHLAAQSAGVSLLDWSATTSQLALPLGAELPGLYGRAATLASGYRAVVDERSGMTVYRDVPEALAVTLHQRLAG